MAQSRPHSDTEEQRSFPTTPSKESANGTPVTDDQCPNLDDEVTVARGVDLAIPQKREREASLELATPHPDDTVNEPSSHGNRSQSPVKKSRALSTPAEADENDNEEEFVDALEDGAPIPSPRPLSPHQTEVCQPSQGVDDIKGCNGQKSPQGSADALPTVVVSENATTSDVQSQIGISSPTPATTNLESQNQPDIVEVSRVGEIDTKAPTGESAVPAVVEPSIGSSGAEEAEVPVTTSVKPISQPEAQSTPEIDSPNQPHSHAADMRADSNARETKRPSPPLSEVDGATKRPREDEDGDLDPNPREAKRATPPPDKDKDQERMERPTRKKSGSDAHAPSAPASPRSKPTSSFGGGGFLAYASTESPFAALKGPSLFGSSSTLTKSSTLTTTKTIATPSNTNAAPPLIISSSLPSSPPKTVPNSPVQRAASPTPAKRTGFEAFASAASPFASAAARTRSPVRRSGSPGPGTGSRSNPFAVYAASGTQSLFSVSGAPAAKRARGDSESIAPGECNESSSWREGSAGDEKTFGERLRAGSGSGGEEDEADGGSGVWGEHSLSGKWAEQEVLTGEEEDETIHSVRGKLYVLSEQNQWKERGTGLLRLNRRRVDRSGARLVMRKDAVYAVLLNVTLFRGMSCAIAQDPRYLRFSVLAPSGTIHYNMRVGSAQAAADLLKAINDNIPRV